MAVSKISRGWTPGYQFYVTFILCHKCGKLCLVTPLDKQGKKGGWEEWGGKGFEGFVEGGMLVI